MLRRTYVDTVAIGTDDHKEQEEESSGSRSPTTAPCAPRKISSGARPTRSPSRSSSTCLPVKRRDTAGAEGRARQ
eukprot:8413920-Pyramimonas_sp.AAC.1